MVSSVKNASFGRAVFSSSLLHIHIKHIHLHALCKWFVSFTFTGPPTDEFLSSSLTVSQIPVTLPLHTDACVFFFTVSPGNNQLLGSVVATVHPYTVDTTSLLATHECREFQWDPYVTVSISRL